MAAPPSRVCPLCGSQDYLDPPLALPEGAWQFACRGPHESYVFDVTPDNEVADYPAGLAADLGLYDDLPALITDPDELVEYGVVEYRYGTEHPKEYQQLLRTYGHSSLKSRRGYTSSSFIAGVLSRLWTTGVLLGEFGPATGYWSYNGTVSHWSPAGASPTRVVSWHDFAESQGLDPQRWPLT